MNGKNILVELMRHMEWADSIVWKSIFKCAGSEEDKKLKDILTHYHTVQNLYIHVWEEKPYNREEQTGMTDLKSILQKVIEYYKTLNNFCGEIDKYDLDKVAAYPWIGRITKLLGRSPADVTLSEMVLHVAMHTSHHRGQVNKRLRELGGAPQTIDFIAWAWLGKPDADWEKIF